MELMSLHINRTGFPPPTTPSYSSKQLKAPVTATATQPLSWPAARAKRLKVGNYHFLRPDNAKKQAAHFVGNADIHPGDLLVCYWENTSDGHPSIPDAAIFIAEVKKRKPTNKVGLYCNASDWTSTAVKAGDFLWIAHYGVKKSAIQAKWDFWQYADKPSHGANIDQNKSRFMTRDELKGWADEAPRRSTPALNRPAVTASGP